MLRDRPRDPQSPRDRLPVQRHRQRRMYTPLPQVHLLPQPPAEILEESYDQPEPHPQLHVTRRTRHRRIDRRHHLVRARSQHHLLPAAAHRDPPRPQPQRRVQTQRQLPHPPQQLLLPVREDRAPQLRQLLPREAVPVEAHAHVVRVDVERDARRPAQRRRLHQLEHIPTRIHQLKLLHLRPRLRAVEGEAPARVDLAAGPQLIQEPTQLLIVGHRSSATAPRRPSSPASRPTPTRPRRAERTP